MILATSNFWAGFVPLAPKLRMNPNERCWCASGLKWKRCHRDRELGTPVPAAALMHIFREHAEIGICMHPDAPSGCGGQPARSHTVQRARSLKAIADSTGHVLSGRNSKFSEDRTADRLTPVGINFASTFRGFCARHDATVFAPADRSSNVDLAVAFLLGYRALAYELFLKMRALEALRVVRQKSDAGRPFFEQVRLQNHWHAFEHSFAVGVREHEVFKKDFDTTLHSGSYSSYRYLSIEFDGTLPFVTSGAFFPEYDFSGNVVQRIWGNVHALGLLTFNVCTIGRSSVALFGWLENGNRAAQNFVDSFVSLPDDRVADALLQFSFETSDNLFVSPTWWNEIDAALRDDLERRLRESLPGERRANGLLPVLNTLAQMPAAASKNY